MYIVYYAHRQQRLITQKLLLQVITKSDQSVYCRGQFPTVTLLLYLVTGLLWWGGIVCVYLGPSSLGLEWTRLSLRFGVFEHEPKKGLKETCHIYYDDMDILPRNSSFNKSYAEFNGDQCLS